MNKNNTMNIPQNIAIRLLQAVLIFFCWQGVLAQKVVRYELYVKDTLVSYAGKKKEPSLLTDRYQCLLLPLQKEIPQKL